MPDKATLMSKFEELEQQTQQATLDHELQIVVMGPLGK